MIYEIDFQDVKNINDSVIRKAKSWDTNSKENHHLLKESSLMSCISGIFYRNFEGTYLNAPIAKLAGLILYRIAEGQFFENANKRTALISMRVFLMKNGYGLKYTKKEMSDLMWGFAKPMDGNNPKYTEKDSIYFVEEKIYILP